MISITLSSKRKPKVTSKPRWLTTTHQNWHHQTPSMADVTTPKTHISGSGMSMFDKAVARDTIIKELTENLPYKVGDVCQPSTILNREKYGQKVRVDKIIKSYAQFPKSMVWPDDNKPMLVQIECLDTGELLDCTVNWIEPKQ